MDLKAALSVTYEVVTASNLCDALIKLSQEFPSALVLDMISRTVPAFDLLKQKQKIRALQKTPTILIGEMSDAELERAMTLGVVAATNVNDVFKELETVLKSR